jgi:hypothetical protein
MYPERCFRKQYWVLDVTATYTLQLGHQDINLPAGVRMVYPFPQLGNLYRTSPVKGNNHKSKLR